MFALCWTRSHETRDGDLQHVWEPVAQHPPPFLFLGSGQRLTFFAEAAPIAREAKADESIDLIDAGTSILTGAGDTVIDVWRGGGEGGA